ncbi:hypothetical protein OH687_11395 [Burkholderia anthina]|nr:hypothetical protein OH687_11395 [Burkholderia anthina]
MNAMLPMPIPETRIVAFCEARYFLRRIDMETSHAVKEVTEPGQLLTIGLVRKWAHVRT